MLQRLSIALVQVKTGQTPKIYLNKIRQIIYALYGAKQITKKSRYQYYEFNKVIKQNGY